MQNTTTKIKAAVLATAIGLALGACGSDDEAGSANGDSAGDSANAVDIKVFMFEPSPLTVAAGTTVKFTNQDEILHTVVSGVRGKPTDDFDEDLDDVGSAAEITFDKPGTVDYFCDIHAGMDGQVIVE